MPGRGGCEALRGDGRRRRSSSPPHCPPSLRTNAGAPGGLPVAGPWASSGRIPRSSTSSRRYPIRRRRSRRAALRDGDRRPSAARPGVGGPASRPGARCSSPRAHGADAPAIQLQALRRVCATRGGRAQTASPPPGGLPQPPAERVVVTRRVLRAPVRARCPRARARSAAPRRRVDGSRQPASRYASRSPSPAGRRRQVSPPAGGATAGAVARVPKAAS
jgi:hypothetical protein